MAYLDYAAATPVDEAIIKAMKPYWQQRFHNPAAIYTDGRKSARELQNARNQAASALGVRGSEIMFTAGATEANNLAINGIMERYPKGRVVISNIEHESVRQPAFGTGRVYELSVRGDGRVDLDNLAASIGEDTVLISIEYVNSEIGVVQPIPAIAKLVAKSLQTRRDQSNSLPLFLHTDTSQAAGVLSLDLKALGVDLATVNGAKMYAPKQSGLLYVRRDVKLAPLLRGGGQEQGLRSGTENLAFAAGIAKALKLSKSRRTEDTKRYKTLQDRLLAGIKNLPETVINGSLEHRAPNNLNVSFKGVDGETLIHHLDAKGIQAATGSACLVSKNQPSYVLAAIGRSQEEVNGSLRLTFGRQTTSADIDLAIEALNELVPKLRKR